MASLVGEIVRRTALQFCVHTGMNQTDTHKKLKYTDRNSSVSITLVFKLRNQFNDGWTDSEQHGQKPSMTVGNVTVTKDVNDDNRRETVREVALCSKINKLQ